MVARPCNSEVPPHLTVAEHHGRWRRRGRRVAKALLAALAELSSYPVLWRPGMRGWHGLPLSGDAPKPGHERRTR